MSQSHRVDFCLVHRLKWKIVPPPAVIPPKPSRIIRFPNYRQDIGFYPRTGVMLGVSWSFAIVGAYLFYKFFAEPGRARMREFYFAIPGSDDPDSEFFRQWQANLPDFPEHDADELKRLQDAHWTEVFPECPLVPYDVPGWDRRKLKGLDLKTAMKNERCILDINFIYPH